MDNDLKEEDKLFIYFR